MFEFFRFAGLSVNISRHCAEQSVNMDANSPRKLFKYLGTHYRNMRLSFKNNQTAHSLTSLSVSLYLSLSENVQGFMLTDLGMDTTDADMVLKALKKEYGTSGSAPTVSPTDLHAVRD